MNINEIQAGRMYSWVYESDMKLNKGGRAGVPVNPFFGRVTVRKVKAGQAATGEMLQRKSLALNPNYQPDPNHTPRWEATSHPCVVKSIQFGELAVRVLSPRTVKVERFLDGKPMTEEDWQKLSGTKGWLPASRPLDPTKVKVNFIKTDNLANLDGAEALEAAEDED